MAEDVLSPAELELLLSSLESDDGPTAPPTPQPAPPERTAAPQPATVATKPAERITAYDFQRPQPARKDSLAALQMLHEPLGRHWSRALSVLLRTSVEVRLAPLEQITYGEFCGGLENPTCLHVVRGSGFEGPLFLDFSPALVFPLIDRLLGGGRDPSPVVRRPLTEIELRLAARVRALFLDALQATWHDVLPTDFMVERVESNPAAVTIVAPTEVVALAKLEVTIGLSQGCAKLAISRRAWDEVSRKIAEQSWAAAGGSATGIQSEALVENLQSAPLELVARLAETKITSAELFNLRVGDIITTDKSVRSPIAVCVAGVTKFRAHAGAFQGYKAVRIDQSVHSPDARPPAP